MRRFELRRDFDSSARRRRDPSPVTTRQSWYPGLLIRPSHASIIRLAPFCLATLWAISSSDAALTSTARDTRRRHPPPATSRKSWYPDLLMRPSQAPISRLAELKCCTSLSLPTLLNGNIFTLWARATKRLHSNKRLRVDEGRRRASDNATHAPSP